MLSAAAALRLVLMPSHESPRPRARVGPPLGTPGEVRGDADGVQVLPSEPVGRRRRLRAPSNRALRPPPPAPMSTLATGRVVPQFSGARRAAAPLEHRPLEGRGPTPTRACGACPRTRNAPPRPCSIPGDITVLRFISRRLMPGSYTASKGSSRMAAAQQLVAARLPRVPTASSTPRIARDAPTPRHRPPSRR